MWISRLLYLIGCWVLMLCVAQCIPLLAAIFLEEKQSFQSIFSALLFSSLIGGSLFLGFRSTIKFRTPRLTIMLPLCGTIALGFVAGLPFFFLYPDQGLIVCFFEGLSLITTNGSSAYEGAYEGLQALILWRGIVAWVGGYLAVCVTLSFLTSLNIGGLQVHQSPMPFGDSNAGYPRLRATAKALYPAYISVTFLCFLLLCISGIGSFDALILAFATLSSAGIFSGAVEGTSAFAPQFIMSLFMFLTVMNWDIHYARFTKRRLRSARDSEGLSLFFTVITISAFLFFIAGSFSVTGLWESIYATISAVSTTGVIPVGFFDNSDHPLTIAIALMFAAAVGGCAIGTGGGIKQLRAIVVYKAGRREVERLAHPHGVSSISIDRVDVQKGDLEAVWLLFGGFVLILALGSLLLAVFGIHFQDALTMAFASITLSGPLISVTNPSFAGFSGLQDADYIVLSALMLFGRVESSLLLALFAKALWRA